MYYTDACGVPHDRTVPPLKPLKTGTCMSGPGSLGRPSGQRYVDVDQRFGPPQPRTPRHTDGVDRGGARPLLGPSSSSCLPQYPAPYATLPLRCPLERPSPSRLSRNAKGTSLSQVRVPQEPTWDAQQRSGVWCDIWASMTLTAGGSVRLSKAQTPSRLLYAARSSARGRGRRAASTPTPWDRRTNRRSPADVCSEMAPNLRRGDRSSAAVL